MSRKWTLVIYSYYDYYYVYLLINSIESIDFHTDWIWCSMWVLRLRYTNWCLWCRHIEEGIRKRQLDIFALYINRNANTIKVNLVYIKTQKCIYINSSLFFSPFSCSFFANILIYVSFYLNFAFFLNPFFLYRSKKNENQDMSKCNVYWGSLYVSFLLVCLLYL